MKKNIEQHDIVYEEAPQFWQDGFPLGNGHFGALAYQKDGVEFAFSKQDVWDRRCEMAPKLPLDEFRAILSKQGIDAAAKEIDKEFVGRSYEYPTPKSCGCLNISTGAVYNNSFPVTTSISNTKQRLRLEKAVVESEYEVAPKAVCVESFIDSESNLFVAEVKDSWLNSAFEYDFTQEVSLLREIDPLLGTPQTGFAGSVMWIKYRFPDGFEYVMAAGITGADCSVPVCVAGKVKTDVRLTYEDKLPKSYSIFVTVVTSKETDNCLSQAVSTIEQAVSNGVSFYKKRHQYWWDSFWKKSSITLDDKELEKLWYFSLYQYAGSSRGKTAPGLLGLWNHLDITPWHGDYHGDICMSMTYWGCFSSNHLELTEPFVETFTKLLPVFKEQTMEMYGIDGIKFPQATLDTGVELTCGHYRMMQCSSGFYALTFWWLYLYTLDEDFLKDTVFYILEQSSKFYTALCEQTEEGVQIGPSWAPEQGPFPCYNSANDLALIKQVWLAYKRSCELLDIQSDVLEDVKYFLDRFPAYAQKDGILLDSYTAKDHITLNHPGLLAMVSPAAEVDAGHPLADVAIKTMNTYLDRTYRNSLDGKGPADDHTWIWLASVAVKLQDKAFAEKMIDYGLRLFTKPNGMFSWFPNEQICDKQSRRLAYGDGQSAENVHRFRFLSGVSEKAIRRQIQFIQEPAGFIHVINEMMMQSHAGVIRLFPSVLPHIKECSFENLRAEGAFLVSGSFADGNIVSLKIKSLKGGVCDIRGLDTMVEFVKIVADNKKISYVYKGGLISFETLPDKEYKFYFRND
ncbi:MAG: glycosyl hydrolase family 95 catalytic domain-containing protein [Sedimentisphaeraceae bacterium JB056]